MAKKIFSVFNNYMEIKINSLQTNNLNFNARGHYIGKKAKIIIPPAILAAVGDTFQRRKPEEPIDNFFDDVIDINPEQIVCDDEKSFDNYYHIDMYMLGSKNYRDRELFNPLLDDEQSTYYSQYENDDIEAVDNTNILRNNYGNYRLVDKDFGDTEMPEVVTSPHCSEKSNVVYTYPYRNLYDEIIKLATVRDSLIKFVDKQLKNIASILINNTEDKAVSPAIESIMSKLKKQDVTVSAVTNKLVIDLVAKQMPNEEINNYLGEFIKNQKNGYYGLMKYYDPKTNKYDRKLIKKDNRFDLLALIPRK